MVAFVDESLRLRVVDAFINASAVLEEADVRLPVSHTHTRTHAHTHAHGHAHARARAHTHTRSTCN